MNYPGVGQQPPMYAPPKKKIPVVPIVSGVLGCGCLLIVLVVAVGIKAFHTVQAGTSEATVVGNSFIDAMGHHKYAVAYSLFSLEAKSSVSADDLRDMETLVEKKHGAFVGRGQPQWYMQNWNGQTSVLLTYRAQFAKAPDTATLTLVPTKKGCRVFSAHYNL